MAKGWADLKGGLMAVMRVDWKALEKAVRMGWTKAVTIAVKRGNWMAPWKDVEKDN